MYAAGRGISRGIVGIQRAAEKPKWTRPKRHVPLKQRLYIPFMWSTCLGSFLGLLVLTGGTAMSVFAYHSKFYASKEIITHDGNTTDSVIVTDDNLEMFLSHLMYVGPLLMGVGAFLIIFACVIVFETRDKVLDVLDDRQRSMAKKNPSLYELIQADIRRENMHCQRGPRRYKYDDRDYGDAIPVI